MPVTFLRLSLQPADLELDQVHQLYTVSDKDQVLVLQSTLPAESVPHHRCPNQVTGFFQATCFSLVLPSASSATQLHPGCLLLFPDDMRSVLQLPVH